MPETPDFQPEDFDIPPENPDIHQELRDTKYISKLTIAAGTLGTAVALGPSLLDPEGPPYHDFERGMIFGISLVCLTVGIKVYRAATRREHALEAEEGQQDVS